DLKASAGKESRITVTICAPACAASRCRRGLDGAHRVVRVRAPFPFSAVWLLAAQEQIPELLVRAQAKQQIPIAAIVRIHREKAVALHGPEQESSERVTVIQGVAGESLRLLPRVVAADVMRLDEIDDKATCRLANEDEIGV